MAEPLVSVVVRSMARPMLGRALDSLAQQDYAGIEVVIANAFGPGHPPVPNHAGRHPIRFVESDRRLSRPEAANAGQDAANGDWITFLDDDDTVLPHHISGLVTAASRAGDARLIHSYALVILGDGRTQQFGHPSAMIELYRFNYISMATSLWSRTLLDLGVRFDPNCTTQEDWDFFLQCGQHTRFHFEPLRTLHYYADDGESGTWGGNNLDAEQIRRMVEYVHRKWQPYRDRLVETVRPLLQRAAACALQNDFDGTRTLLDQVFAVSQSDPFGLSILATIERAAGRLDAAEAAQRLATEIRPRDHRMVYDLAVILRERGDVVSARKCAQYALQLAPTFAPARSFFATLQPI